MSDSIKKALHTLQGLEKNRSLSSASKDSLDNNADNPRNRSTSFMSKIKKVFSSDDLESSASFDNGRHSPPHIDENSYSELPIEIHLDATDFINPNIAPTSKKEFEFLAEHTRLQEELLTKLAVFTPGEQTLRITIKCASINDKFNKYPDALSELHPFWRLLRYTKVSSLVLDSFQPSFPQSEKGSDKKSQETYVRLAEALSKNPSLQWLQFRKSPLAYPIAAQIPAVVIPAIIANNSRLEPISQPEGSTSLKYLSFTDVAFTEADVSQIATAIPLTKENCSPYLLDLTACGLNNNNNVQPLAKLLAENKAVKRLRLNDNEFGNEGMQIIASGLTTNTVLEQLWIRNNNIGEAGFMALAAALQANPATKLTDIHIAGKNSLTEKSFAALVASLPATTKLHVAYRQIESFAEKMVVANNNVVATQAPAGFAFVTSMVTSSRKTAEKPAANDATQIVSTPVSSSSNSRGIPSSSEAPKRYAPPLAPAIVVSAFDNQKRNGVRFNSEIMVEPISLTSSNSTAEIAKDKPAVLQKPSTGGSSKIAEMAKKFEKTDPEGKVKCK